MEIFSTCLDIQIDRIGDRIFLFSSTQSRNRLVNFLPKVPNVKMLLLTANYFKRIEGRKQFQKAVFLLQEYHKIEFTYPFIPYLYGPYSSQLQNDIDNLARTGYLKASKIGPLYYYDITSLGQMVASEVEKEYGQNQSKELAQKVSDLKECTTDELVQWSKQLMKEKYKDKFVFPW
jgi:uncharacterized protein YwgA